MKRMLLSVVFIVLLAVPSIMAPISAEAKVKTFNDVQATHANYTEIMEMANKGIISGYPDGTFKPNQKISRKHVATLLSRAFPEKPVRLYRAEDLNKSDPYYNDIMRALGSDWLRTTSTFKVRPNDNMTRGEMAIALGALLPDDMYKAGSKKV
ncbi:S-layer homology domain-containing protein [Sporosarcina cyprini]|uniref:S-layer homology domain-containing protein n=1 Tax=Sporosarcina cyprini TaxID=2910523 RepID=UPI001EDD6B44|nr:S-layer homology domain-containing protein [Sporosarcina cyprini]MCG3088276.1 S-layer homology domain-containing protein [Sporosarcina cyprini]